MRARWKRPMIAGLLLLAALALRTAFLGFSTLYHGEAEFAEGIAYVLPALKQDSLPEAMWRLWHLFILNLNALYWLFPIHVPVAWWIGIREATLRLPEALGGVASCLLVYRLVRRHADHRTALIALALVVFHPFLVAFNRFAFPDSVQAAVLLGGLLLLDHYTQNRRLIQLAGASVCFALAYLIKMNAMLMVIPLLVMYHYVGGLRWRDVLLAIVLAAGTVLGLFIDQMGVFLHSIFQGPPLRELIVKHLARLLLDTRFYLRACVLYGEHTIIPLLICLAAWRTTRERLFRILVSFSVIYFLILCVQGRTFFRYLQIGMFTTMMAFAYPLSRFVEQQRSHGLACVAAYIAWGLVVHGSYGASQYHHIPYRYLRERVQQLQDTGRVFAFGRNSETDYYLSPSHVRRLDQTVDLRAVTVVPERNTQVPTDRFLNIPLDQLRDPKIEDLLEPGTVKSGDLVVVSGIQMAGGEPSPQSLGIRRWGLRRYGHLLGPVQEFERAYGQNVALQQQYEMVERVSLTHSQTVAALILRKR